MPTGMRFRVRDPVHNFIRLRDDEVRLLDTRAIQRLRGISQLAMANLVYPGAVHTRFDHSLGVTHVAGQMAEELFSGNEEEVELVRKAALLHDVGHGPFSHVSEECLERYADRSKVPPEQKREKIHELISAKIIRTNEEIVRLLGAATCENVVRLLGKGHGEPAKRSIVSGPLDADKQDYLLRDSHFCGVPYGIFDIHQLHRSLILGGPEGEKQLMIKSDGVHAVEQYVLAKYYLTTNVYRHKVRLITDQMIVRAIEVGIEQDGIEELSRLYAYDGSDDFVTNYQGWDDGRFMHEFCVLGKGTGCQELLIRLRERRLLKRVFDGRPTDFPPEMREMLLNLSRVENKELKARIEAAMAEKIGQIAGKAVDPNLVVLNAFSIRSVRQMSRNDEAGILVQREPRPRPFGEESTLFKSINERYSDEFVEVYAVVEWGTQADKKRIRRDLREPIMELIAEKCRDYLEGDAK